MDEQKIAAAILAAEAARQKEVISPSPRGKDITGELFSYYQHFLGRISEKQQG